MSRLALLLLLLAVGSDIAYAECTCPVSWSFSYEETASSEAVEPFISLGDSKTSSAKLIACGFVEGKQKKRVIASEFMLFHCEADNKLTPLLFRSALTQAWFTKTKDSLIITEFERWPFGKNWKWMDVPTVRHNLPAGTKNHKQVDSQIVLKPITLTKKQIDGVLSEYARFKKTDIYSIPPENINTIVETIIGKLLVAALAGSDAAVDALGEMRLLDAHYGETATEALETYNLYRSKQINEK